MLGDGFRVEARIAIWQADDVVMVPVGALFRRGGDWAVFVVRDGRALLRTVDLGERNNETAHVKDGVRDGERVIAHPPDTLEDGAPVRERM